jgi:hypothetical protein
LPCSSTTGSANCSASCTGTPPCTSSCSVPTPPGGGCPANVQCVSSCACDGLVDPQKCKCH